MRNIFAAFLSLSLAYILSAGPIKYIRSDAKTGTSAAVEVGPTALAHTAQLLPVDKAGQLVGPGNAAVQAERVLDNLETSLQAAKSSLAQVVKLNVYCRNQEAADETRKVLAARFAKEAKPAVSFVVGKLPHEGALVCMDAVAVSLVEPPGPAPERIVAKELSELDAGTHVAVLPDGPVVYVAGQAERGANLAESTRKTMQSLGSTLKFLKLTDDHVVQVKAFLDPMSDLSEVKREMAAFFKPGKVPPLVFVEWTSAKSIEIELIASVPKPKETPEETVDYLTPPGMKPSPVYSKVSRINHGNRIYTSGLYGAGKNGTAEVRDIFDQLQGILRLTGGGDLKHLAKATYYVSTEDASKKLNELRPEYFDPKRPPSASKAAVTATGIMDRGITLDMIGATKP